MLSLNCKSFYYKTITVRLDVDVKNIRMLIFLSVVGILTVSSIYYNYLESLARQQYAEKLNPAESIEQNMQSVKRLENGSFVDPKLEEKRQDLIKKLNDNGFALTEKDGKFIIQSKQSGKYSEEQLNKITAQIKEDFSNILLETMKKKGVHIASPNELTAQDREMIAKSNEQLESYFNSEEYKKIQERDKKLLEELRNN